MPLEELFLFDFLNKEQVNLLLLIFLLMKEMIFIILPLLLQLVSSLSYYIIWYYCLLYNTIYRLITWLLIASPILYHTILHYTTQYDIPIDEGNDLHNTPSPTQLVSSSSYYMITIAYPYTILYNTILSYTTLHNTKFQLMKVMIYIWDCSIIIT
jgi:hypothetical protein